MGRYCDICKISDEDNVIGWISIDNEYDGWCRFDLEVCSDCAKDIKDAIFKVGDRKVK